MSKPIEESENDFNILIVKSYFGFNVLFILCGYPKSNIHPSEPEFVNV
jgi:hypothetical protein